MLIWLVLSIPNFACYIVLGWPSLVIGVLLVVDFATHLVAYVKCQPVVCSRLIGGEGKERMVLHVSGRGSFADWFKGKVEGTRLG